MSCHILPGLATMLHELRAEPLGCDAEARAQAQGEGFKVLISIDPGRREIITVVRVVDGVETTMRVDTKQFNRMAGIHRTQARKCKMMRKAGEHLCSASCGRVCCVVTLGMKACALEDAKP